MFVCLLPPCRSLQLSRSDAEYGFARIVLAEFPSSQMEENRAVSSRSRTLTALRNRGAGELQFRTDLFGSGWVVLFLFFPPEVVKGYKNQSLEKTHKIVSSFKDEISGR